MPNRTRIGDSPTEYWNEYDKISTGLNTYQKQQ